MRWLFFPPLLKARKNQRCQPVGLISKLQQRHVAIAFKSRAVDQDPAPQTGEKMPQKATYFYPKLITGLVINKIDPEEEIPDEPEGQA